MDEILKYLSNTFWGNSYKNWLLFLVFSITLFFVIKTLFRIFIKRLKKFAGATDTILDDLIADLLSNTKAFFILAASLYISISFLEVSQKLSNFADKAFTTLLFLQIAYWGTSIISSYTKYYKEKNLESDAASVTSFSAMTFIGKIILYAVIVLLILDNLGVNITALIAGLGVGGIAIALAMQNILSDLFASLSIVMDKPFVLGDTIFIDNFVGTVEHIGLKTTRLRSVSGEQLIFSNADLLKSRIRNFKRMEKRRVLFSVGVIYQTTEEQLKMIPGMIKEIIEKHNEAAQFDRCHFKELGSSSLNFETVYWINSPDFKEYMDINEKINLDIFSAFKNKGIEFAYPTQTLFVEK